jgi:hypothetical protein
VQYKQGNAYTSMQDQQGWQKHVHFTVE